MAAFGFTVEGGSLEYEAFGLAVPPHSPLATNNVAEYTGAIRALEYLEGRGYRGPVELRGDSQLVIRQMNGGYVVRARHLMPLHQRLMALSNRFAATRYVWIPRSENARADELSKEGLAQASGGAWTAGGGFDR